MTLVYDSGRNHQSTADEKISDLSSKCRGCSLDKELDKYFEQFDYYTCNRTHRE